MVRSELAASKGGTLLRVTHSGLSNLPVSRKDYSGGWPGVVEQIKKFIEGLGETVDSRAIASPPIKKES